MTWKPGGLLSITSLWRQLDGPQNALERAGVLEQIPLPQFRFELREKRAAARVFGFASAASVDY